MATGSNGSESSKAQLPGFTLPYYYVRDDGFASALDIAGTFQMPLTTLREFTMMRLVNQLTDKPHWDEKVFDEDIAKKWKLEAMAQPGVDITQEMVDWCIEELRYKAKAFRKTGMVTVYNGDVVKSDTAVPDVLRQTLLEAVKPLEDVPPSELDWHPGSDGKVLDLVHPSLYPLVYGQSRILSNEVTSLDDCIARTGQGETLYLCVGEGTLPPKRSPPFWDAFSIKFQWLPCDVDVSGDEPRIKSYINNLHPRRHNELYHAIEKVIGCAIPLWNESLTRQKTGEYRFARVNCDSVCPEEEIPKPERGSDEDQDSFYERLDAWDEAYMASKAAQPDIGKFESLGAWLFEQDGETLKPEYRVDLQRDYGKIQVIVKLANIHLTPEKPKYEGGTWHVEGQMNEHICASALYYYSSNNITPSQLAFRHIADPDETMEINYDQGYRRWLEDIFGCQDEEPSIQDIGSVLTNEGRLITFPNILQHQVQPFELADPTKPGHRKILALFLVDPNIPIISSAHVPCQRKDWWRAMINEDDTHMGKLPLEIKDNIYDMVDEFPISLEDAKRLRLELMKERMQFQIKQQGVFSDITFSLCEH